MDSNAIQSDVEQILSAQDLLAGSSVIHNVQIPQEILAPGQKPGGDSSVGKVRLKPLSVATLALISRAARDDISLVPILMIKESMVEPALSLDQVRQMHIGLVEFLVNKVNEVSGIGGQDDPVGESVNTPVGRTHVLLAQHFGWTPEQVGQLTPGQVAVYLAGIEKLLALEQPGQ